MGVFILAGSSSYTVNAHWGVNCFQYEVFPILGDGTMVSVTTLWFTYAHTIFHKRIEIWGSILVKKTNARAIEMIFH